MSGDLVCLAYVSGDEESINAAIITIIGERIVDTVFPRRALAEIQRLVVCLSHDALGGEVGKEIVLAGCEGWVDVGETAFGAGVGRVVLDNV